MWDQRAARTLAHSDLLWRDVCRIPAHTRDRVQRLELWMDLPKPSVSAEDLQLGTQTGNAHARRMWLDVMLDNIAMVFGSGMNSGEGGDQSPKNLP